MSEGIQMSWSKHITAFLGEPSDKEHIKVQKDIG